MMLKKIMHVIGVEQHNQTDRLVSGKTIHQLQDQVAEKQVDW